MARYYYGGAFKYPVRMTQKLWDEITERRRQFEQWNKEDPSFPRVDTIYGNDDIGERPKTPDWVYPTLQFILYTASFISLVFLMYIFRRGY